MKRIVASAPGKLVLTGEYAVLEGASAVVLAVDRRARVVLDDHDGDDYRIEAPDIGVAVAHCRIEAAGRVRWVDVDGDRAARLALVAAVLQAAAQNGAPAPFRVGLDTREFVAADGVGLQAKLGLGSSAAIAVALSGAIHVREGRQPPSPRSLIDAHRRFQGGRGSGLDVAASLSGGATIYRRRRGEPQITPAAWLGEIGLCCVWTGRAASTRAMLEHMAAWRAREPALCASLMEELAAVAAIAADALRAGNARALLDAVRDYAGGLDRLGRASGVDIVCAEHRAIGAIAAAHGVTYKSCGAGGGDVGVALAIDA
ncbi:MAG TPA: hypothetical protein VFF72_03415, partial [Caldimonas sp.]|nr:hypothetical protein [Caldimonas sp.]